MDSQSSVRGNFGSSRAWRSEGRYFCREGWRGFENTVAGLSDVQLQNSACDARLQGRLTSDALGQMKRVTERGTERSGLYEDPSLGEFIFTWTDIACLVCLGFF